MRIQHYHVSHLYIVNFYMTDVIEWFDCNPTLAGHELIALPIMELPDTCAHTHATL